jgi:hypothetical protein
MIWQTKSIELIGDEFDENDYHARLELYRAKKRWREPHR